MSTKGGVRGVRPMWTHVDRGEGSQKTDFFVDVINGWPLGEICGVHIAVMYHQYYHAQFAHQNIL